MTQNSPSTGLVCFKATILTVDADTKSSCSSICFKSGYAKQNGFHLFDTSINGEMGKTTGSQKSLESQCTRWRRRYFHCAYSPTLTIISADQHPADKLFPATTLDRATWSFGINFGFHTRPTWGGLVFSLQAA